MSKTYPEDKIVFYTNSIELQPVADEIRKNGEEKAAAMGFPPNALFCETPEYVASGTCVRITIERVTGK